MCGVRLWDSRDAGVGVDSMEKTGAVLMETYFPKDLFTFRWVHFLLGGGIND